VTVSEEPRPLPTGVVVEREMAAGRIHPYTLRLESGQFLHVGLTQQGIDVALTLVGPDGTRSRDVDFSDGPQGRETLSFLAEASGEFRLEVRSRAGAAGEGRYALRAEPPRSPRPADRDRLAAEGLLSDGHRRHLEGKAEGYRQAIASFAKALPLWRALADDGDDGFFEALCLYREGSSRIRLGEYHEARELFAGALSRWQSTGDRFFEARTLDALGSSHFYVSEYEKALEYYLQALPLRRAVGDREGEAATLNNISIGYGSLGQLRASLSWQEQALELRRALGDRRGQATLLHNMAVVDFMTSRMQKAIDRLQEALALSRALGDRKTEAASLGTLAAVHRELGAPEDALHHYRQALELWREVGNRSGEATVLREMGRTHAALGETAVALQHYQQALDLHRAMGDRAEAGTLFHIGMAHKELGDLGKAAEILMEALRLSQETKDLPHEASVRSGLGQVYAARGDAQKAIAHLEQALALRRRLSDRAEEAFVLHELAKVELGLGQVTQGRQRLEAALGLIEGVRDEVASHELRAALVARSASVHELYLDVLMQEHRRDPAAGFEARAFEASERGRVQSLLEQLAESHLDLREGADPALIEREALLQEQLRFKLEQQMRLLTGPHTPAGVAAAEAEVQAARSDYGMLQARIRVASPRYAALRQPQVLSLAEVQQQVLDPAGTLLLEYALGDERSFLFAVTSGSLRSFTLPGRAEIEAAARRAYDLLTQRRVKAGAEGERAEALGALSRMLVEPVAAELGSERLLVVADGALHYVPFAALPVPGRPSVVLGAEHEIAAAPSASLLAALRQEAAGRKRAARTLAVFADPVFSRDDERVRSKPGRSARAIGGDRWAPSPEPTRSAAEGGLGAEVLPRLPFTRREAQAILALAPARDTRVALSFDATRQAAVGGVLSDYRFVHFATHGFFNDAHPELSGLVLSLVDRDGKPQEGFLSAGEVFNMKLSADLVVLSGCRTALGKQMKGEGVVGLTRAFMYAGTSRVLASLWNVDDAASAALMTRFYEGMLKGGLPPARALQRAQLAVARQRQWRNPYYWAAFQLQGDWE
jgi:CHAT domain-containing protein